MSKAKSILPRGDTTSTIMHRGNVVPMPLTADLREAFSETIINTEQPLRELRDGIEAVFMLANSMASSAGGDCEDSRGFFAVHRELERAYGELSAALERASKGYDRAHKKAAKAGGR